MRVTKQQLLTALAAIEREDPLYLGDMQVSDGEACDVMAASMLDLHASGDFTLATPHCREVTLLATLTHALLEVAALRHRLRGQDRTASDETLNLLTRIGAH